MHHHLPPCRTFYRFGLLWAWTLAFCGLGSSAEGAEVTSWDIFNRASATQRLTRTDWPEILANPATKFVTPQLPLRPAPNGTGVTRDLTFPVKRAQLTFGRVRDVDMGENLTTSVADPTIPGPGLNEAAYNGKN